MTRRMTYLVLAVLGAMVLFVTISPPDRGGDPGSSGTPTPSPAAVEAPLTDPNAFDVSVQLSTGAGAENETVDAEVGDRVEIMVSSADPDSVALGDLSVEAVEADSPARFELLADTPGTYPVVLVSENRRIGSLEIR